MFRYKYQLKHIRDHQQITFITLNGFSLSRGRQMTSQGEEGVLNKFQMFQDGRMFYQGYHYHVMIFDKFLVNELLFLCVTHTHILVGTSFVNGPLSKTPTPFLTLALVLHQLSHLSRYHFSKLLRTSFNLHSI